MAFPQELFSTGMANTTKVVGLATALGIGGVGGVGMKAGFVKRVRQNELGIVIHNGDAYRKNDHLLLRMRQRGKEQPRDEAGNPLPLYGAWWESRRAGKPFPYKKKGLRCCVPGLNTMVIAKIGQQTTPLGSHDYEIGGKQHTVDSEIIWQVREDGDNPVKSLFKTENNETLSQIVASFCLRSLNTVLSSHQSAASIDNETVEEQVRQDSFEHLTNKGVELLNLNLHQVARSREQVTSDGMYGAADRVADGVAERIAQTLGDAFIRPEQSDKPLSNGYANSHANGHINGNGHAEEPVWPSLPLQVISGESTLS